MAEGVVALNCPAIPFMKAEVRRDAYLWRLAAAFQALMDEARNPCALKGGTVLAVPAVRRRCRRAGLGVGLGRRLVVCGGPPRVSRRSS